MKKIKNLIIGGIENKIFNLIMITAIIISAIFLGISSYQNKILAKLSEETKTLQSDSIAQITGNVMEDVVDGSMARTTQLEAMIADDVFKSLGQRVELMAEYAEKLLENQSIQTAPFSQPDKDRNGEVTTQFIKVEDVSINAAFRKKIGILANMSDMMESFFGVSEETNSLFIAFPEGGFLITDDRSAIKYKEDGNLQEYDPRTRPWYIRAVEEGKTIFTDVEVDAFTGDIGIVCARPVYVDGKLEAVVGSDLFLSAMKEAIETSEENGTFLFVTNNNGHVVFSAKEEGILAVYSSDEAQDLRNSDNEELASLVRDSSQQNTDIRLIQVDDKSYYAAGSPIGTLGWSLICLFDQEVSMGPTELLLGSFNQIQEEATVSYRNGSNRIRHITYLLLVLALIGSGIASLVLAKKIVKPLNTITKRISEISNKNQEFVMEDTYKTGDEIEVLAQSFADISHRTVEYVKRIRTVTAEKERISTELDMAQRIQASMIPSIFPAFPDRKEFDIFASVEPAKGVGGDFYDFFLVDENHLCMIMADVSGKGIPAALFMMACKIILQSVAMLGNSPATILKKANEAVCFNNKEGMFVTVWVGILELSTGKMVAANAGHEFPIVKRAEGPFEIYKDHHGIVVGAFEGVDYTEYELDLKAGDKIFLYTDGVPEATNGTMEMFGLENTVKALNIDSSASPSKILNNVRSSIAEFVEDAEQFDDLTMLCCEYKGNKEQE